jgi:DNA-binding NarL/FixJ family response regulator
MEVIRISVVDDHDLFREGIKLVLSQIPGFVVVSEACDGRQFIDSMDQQEIDVVLMDIEMPRLNGIQASREALEKMPGLKIIALTMFSDKGNYTQMINAGAKGFVLKQASKVELREAITAVFHGETYMDKEIQLRGSNSSQGSSAMTGELSMREIEIIVAICEGLTTKDIGDRLCISHKTVETHRTNIFKKTGVRSLAELVIWAIKNHMVSVQ